MQHLVTFGRIATVLPVKNIMISKEFYINGLNFKDVFENGDPVGFMIIKREEAELHLTLQPQHKAASYPIAHLLVDDAKGAVKERAVQSNDVRCGKELIQLRIAQSL